MNRHRISLRLIICMTVICFAGGCSGEKSEFSAPHIPNIYGNNLSKVIAFDSDNILLAGSFGYVGRTSQGSQIKFENSTKDFWEVENTGLEEELLCDMSFPDPQHGWAAGIVGTIIHTSDGGKTWVKQESGTDKHLFAIWFADEKNGWACGNLNTIIHTSDGGKTWVEQEEEESTEKDFFAVDVNYNGLFFHDAEDGWMVGEFGTVYHTTDGGQNWKYVPTPELTPDVGEDGWEAPRPSLFDVYFADRNLGLILGIDGIILRTEDGGKEWARIETPAVRALYSADCEEGKCWAVGAKGTYIVSADSGKTWFSKKGAIHTKGFLTSIAFTDMQTGWVVGKAGAVFKTVDGGENWDWLSGVSYDWPEFKPPKALVGE